jgi:4-amino-4-deoxy-L-arabinose transferase-like glycosyltransferase
VLVAALFLALTRAEQRRDNQALLAAGALLGACLLTKTTLVYLVVPFALVLARSFRAAPRATLAAAVLPGVVLAPWLISNVVRLGTLTANNAAQRQQTPLLYPQGNTFGLDDVPDRLRHLYDGVLPLEWAGQLDVTWVTAAVLLLIVPLLLGALASIRRGRPPVLLPGSALVAGLLIAVVTAIAAHWDIFLLRYLYAVLPALAIVVAATLYRTAGASAIAAGVCVQTVLLGALWLDMAGAFYFTNVGRALGI